MNKKTKLIFSIIFCLFALVMLIIIFSSVFTQNDNYKMDIDTLVNNLRTDTQNYENVNRGHLENYLGKTFTLTGKLYKFEPENNQLVFDSIFKVIYGKLNNNLSNEELKELNTVKRGFTATIKGKFDKVSNFIVIKDSSIIKLYDSNNKLLINNEGKDF